MLWYLIVSALCVTAVSSFGARSHDFSSHQNFRIIGGKPLRVEVAPYQVSLQRFNRHKCGGSIIDQTHVLTAAHCVEKFSAKAVSVRAGSVKLGFGGTVHNVTRIHMHPEYEIGKVDYDLAILDLQTPINTSDKSRPIPISRKYPTTGSLILVTGWGQTRENGTSSKTLLGVYIPVAAPEFCKRRFPSHFSDNMICAGTLQGGKDSCLGDSGGPAMLHGKLVGVTSWGVGCGRAKTPGVYMAVSKFLPFIQLHSVPKIV